MRKIISIIVFLSLSLSADMMNFRTIGHNVVKINENSGIFKFINPKYRNQNVLFFVFGSHCDFCEREMPTIKKLVASNKLKIIGVHGQADIGDYALKKFMRQRGINFDVLSFKDDINLINYLKDRGLWSGEVPLHIFVDKTGNVESVTFEDVLGRV
jgi:thiol-disulfide isomerase/thioredoxin